MGVEELFTQVRPRMVGLGTFAIFISSCVFRRLRDLDGWIDGREYYGGHTVRSGIGVQIDQHRPIHESLGLQDG